MTQETAKKVLIIGAGPAGLSAARVLSESGYSVEIFELESQVGGMSKSVELFSQIVDIGPHRFFSKDKRLNDFWHAHTNGEYEKVSRLTRIFYNRKFFYYPLRGFDALLKLGFIESALCVLSYCKAKILPFKGDSFESWVANAFGYRLYSIFFKGYTEKLWGIKGSELDSDFAAQRIKGLNLYEAIKSAFFGNGGKKHKTLVDEFSYPKKGCGVVYNNMKDEIIKRGGTIHCDVEVVGIKTHNKKAVGTRFRQPVAKEQRFGKYNSFINLARQLWAVPDAQNRDFNRCFDNRRRNFRNTHGAAAHGQRCFVRYRRGGKNLRRYHPKHNR